MTDPAPDPGKTRKPSALVWWMGGGVALVLALVGGVALVALEDDSPRLTGGPGLNISVVAPVEPDIQPGEIMDVGVLNNSFDGRVPQAAPGTGPDALYAEQPAYDEGEGEQGWRAENRWAPGARSDQAKVQSSGGRPDYVRPGPEGDPYARAQPQREVYRERPLSFGFDRPQPDWRAEREARRAAMEAREQAMAEARAQAREEERRAAQADRRYGRSGDPRYDRPRDNGYY